MTTITIYKSNTESIKGFLCEGHAGFARQGRDYVCSAISVLTLNTVNSITELTTQKGISIDQDEKKGMLRFYLDVETTHEAELLLQGMVLGLNEISKEYGKKYLTLKFEEV